MSLVKSYYIFIIETGVGEGTVKIYIFSYYLGAVFVFVLKCIYIKV